MSDPSEPAVPGGLSELWADLGPEDEIDVELLVAHSANPGSLSAEDRGRVEAYLSASPAHRDRQRVLARLAALRPEERVASLLGEEAAEPTGDAFPANVIPLFRRPLARSLALAASVVIALLAAWFATREVEQQTGEPPRYVEETAPLDEQPKQDSPPVPDPSSAVDRQEVLAETPVRPEADTPAVAPPPEEQLAAEPRTPDTTPPDAIPGEPDNPLIAGEPIQLAALLEVGPPSYRAPDGFVDEVRMLGVSRSARAPVTVEALAPLHTGLSAEPSPDLHWFVSGDTQAATRFVLIPVDGDEALLELRRPGPARQGFHAVSLSQEGIELEPGVDYRWMVALAHDPDDPSGDTVAAAEIRRLTAPPEGSATGPAAEAGRRLAAAGLFYDALDFVSEQIERFPSEPALREQRAALLEQVGLDAAARADRVRSGP